MISGAQGSTIVIPFVFTDGGGNPVNVTSPSVQLLDLNGNSQGTFTPTPVGPIGQWELTYAIDHSAPIGLWSSLWHGVVGARPFGWQYMFAVTAVSSLVLCQPSDIYRDTTKAQSSFNDTFLTEVIGMLQGELEVCLARPVTIRNFQEIATLTERQTRVFFKNTPILNVGAVTVNPNTSQPEVLDPASYSVMPWGLVFADPTYTLLFRSNPNAMMGTLEGTELMYSYQAGLDGPNIPIMKAITIRAAAREFLALESDVQNVSMLQIGRA